MKYSIQLRDGLRILLLTLLTLCAAILIFPSSVRAVESSLSSEEFSASLQGETVSVEEFGAVGDGVSDDSEAIEKALNSGAAKVEFSEGKTYLYKKAIIMKSSNVEIAGNGATLAWDEDTPFENWEELLIFGKDPDHPVNNIYLHDLKFLTPNAGDPTGTLERTSSVQLILYNCSDVRVENCEFLITEGAGNRMYEDGGRGATNIWIYGECHNIDITGCSLKNLSHASGVPGYGDAYNGAGGNIWISGYDWTGTGTENTRASDIKIQNNYIEKSCHDESIAVWCAEADEILIDGNEFNLHEKDEVLDYSDMVFTFGNFRGSVDGSTDNVRDLRFTNNKVYAESKNYLILCGGQDGSEPVEISGNDITWVKLGSTATYCGIVNAGDCQIDVALNLKENHILYKDSGEGGSLNRFFGSHKLEVSENVIEIDGGLSCLCDLYDAQGTGDITGIYKNRFVIDSELKYLYMGYNFSDNTVILNVPVKNALFPYYGCDFIRAPKISGNYIRMNSAYEKTGEPKYALLCSSCKLNDYVFDFTDNVIDSAVPQESGDDFDLIFIYGMQDGTEQRINASGSRSNFFQWVYYDGNTVNPVVSMDDTEIRSQTALPLCTAFCTAKLAETASGTYALTYTLTAPEPEITSLYLACYDEKGVMLAIKDLPDAPQKGRDTITLSDFFETFSLTDMRRCKLFLIKNDTWSPVCKNWTGDLPA